MSFARERNRSHALYTIQLVDATRFDGTGYRAKPGKDTVDVHAGRPQARDQLRKAIHEVVRCDDLNFRLRLLRDP